MDAITPIKIQFRMEQWATLIKECQNSGLTVKAWCQQHNIKESVYYYRLKQVRKQACAELPSKNSSDCKPVKFVKLPIHTATGSPTITIHLPFATLDVKEGTSRQTLEAVFEALKALC